MPATHRLLLASRSLQPPFADPEADRAVYSPTIRQHAQGVAHAANRLGINASIIMPEDALDEDPEHEGWWREIILGDRYNESREETGKHIAAKTGATLVRPGDDPDIIAGQGTTGLEIAERQKKSTPL